MRAKAPALKTFAREAYERGVSLREIARVGDLPVGTIKTWRSRGKWERDAHVMTKAEAPMTKGQSRNRSRQNVGASSTDETPAKVEKKGGDETYRGLKACHMPGARSGSKQMTFALFRRNLWPPAVWKVPPGLVGGELLMMLQERSCMNLRKKGSFAKE